MNHQDTEARQLKSRIVKNTKLFSSATLLSRCLGIIREMLAVKYLGAGAVSDAFLTAYKIPNSLRKIFAEGALSAAFIPTLVCEILEDRKRANSLMTLSFVLFEGFVLLLCGLAMIYAPAVIGLIAPGFSPEQVALAVPFLRILMPFIFFISSSALLAGALQAVDHFFIPAIAPALLNVVFISALLICFFYDLPVTHLCFFILFGGLVQFMAHLITYFKLHFSFGPITKQAVNTFSKVIGKFLLCSVSMSIMEISLFVDTSFASYLDKGSISLLYYANRFMGIPLGVFGVALSTTLLPHFSRVAHKDPHKLSFYLLEATKIITWVNIPIALIMGFLSRKIFLTLFLSKNFSVAQVDQASAILIAYLIGLCFFALNKILLNIYYSMHNTWLPAIISSFATLLNIGLNWWLIDTWQATGLALATTASGIFQTLFFVIMLKRHFKFQLNSTQFLSFLARYIVQLTLACGLIFGIYNAIDRLLHSVNSHFFLASYGFWLWVGPLCALGLLSLYTTRKRFGINLFFLD